MKKIYFKKVNCWICEKLIDNDNEKVRDHCYVTGKFRGAAHWSCNINLQLTKKVSIIFHNLKRPLKQKSAYPYEYMNSFERFSEEKLPARKCFLNSTQKMEKLVMMVKNQTVT